MKTRLKTVFLLVLAVSALALFPLSGAVPFGILANFVPGPSGVQPYAGVIQAKDGNYYGTTNRGGVYDRGTIFRLSPSGILKTLVSFNGLNGANPQGKLLQGADGNFYGTTSNGGAFFQAGANLGYGTVYKMTPEGVLTTLYSLAVPYGSFPAAALIQGVDGSIYGTTVQGYLGGLYPGYGGSVFKLTLAGEFTILATFPNQELWGALVQGPGGNFYGTTVSFDQSTFGTIFKMDSYGQVTTLTSFTGPDGADPYPGLTLGRDGNFYGCTYRGGILNLGTVYKVSSQGARTSLFSFHGGADGAHPFTQLVAGADGNLYGTTYEGGRWNKGTIFRISESGVLATLASFNENRGRAPNELLRSSDGDLYTTTTDGGSFGAGTILKLSSSGLLTTLVSFQGSNGSSPQSALVQDADGIFYGTTESGGQAGKGTIFKMSPAGLVTTLASFDGANGASPKAPLVQGKDGNFYGTTSKGGASDLGTVFKVTPSGILTRLASFNGANGSLPLAGLVQGVDGNFYGVASQGGAKGGGTMFNVTPSGLLKVLVQFDFNTNGGLPMGGLIQGRDGNFYGTTYEGGGGDGTVFKVTAKGVLTTLAKLSRTNSSLPSRAAGPLGTLIEGPDGNFYGTASSGGTEGNLGHGAVFKVTPGGVLTTFVEFKGLDGNAPQGGLILAGDGNFYGTTSKGGSTYQDEYNKPGLGTVFRLTPAAGKLSTLFSFDGTHGTFPQAALVEGKDGNLYGTASYGGRTGTGLIFALALKSPHSQAITFPKVEGAMEGQTLMLTATASSGLPIEYQVLSGPARVSGSKVIFTGTGGVKLSASQSGNVIFQAAKQVVQNLVVKKAPPLVTK